MGRAVILFSGSAPHIPDRGRLQGCMFSHAMEPAFNSLVNTDMCTCWWLRFLHVLFSNATVKSLRVTWLSDTACISEFLPFYAQNAVKGIVWSLTVHTINFLLLNGYICTCKCLEILIFMEHFKCKWLNLWFSHLNRILSFGNLGKLFVYSIV